MTTTSPVLVVDDSPSMRQAIDFVLSRGGFSVTEAADGNEALQYARNQRFSLIITDINMPGMDGFTLIRELRKQPDYKGVPILALTTEISRESKDEGRDAGATGWITKPFEPDKLLEILNKVMN
jgi:two-component system chemotaxis response regulator CheY